LPKIEKFHDKLFLITRYYNENCMEGDDLTTGNLTNRVAFMVSNTFVITIHREDLKPFWKMRRKWDRKFSHYPSRRLLNSLLDRILETYEKPLLSKFFRWFPWFYCAAVARISPFGWFRTTKDCVELLDDYEELLFSTSGADSVRLIRNAYNVKRKAQVLSRILTMTGMVVHRYRKLTGQLDDSYSQDLEDTVLSLRERAEEVHDTGRNLIEMHVAVFSHNTNQTLAVLTNVSLVCTSFSLWH
jgi:Mg2+ and Co2+ transporter CorA